MKRRFGPLLLVVSVLLLDIDEAGAQATEQVARPGEPHVGRLFFTPEQREALDQQRRIAIANANRPAVAKPEAEKPKLPPRDMTLNGVIRRSDGETTVWVNGKPLHGGFAEADIAPGSIGREGVAVTLPGSSKRVELKVGQTVDATTGAVEESYARRPRASEPDAQSAEPAPETPTPRPRRARRRDDRDDYYPMPSQPTAPAPSESIPQAGLPVPRPNPADDGQVY